MTRQFNSIRASLFLLVAFSLSHCSGGGSDSGSPPPSNSNNNPGSSSSSATITVGSPAQNASLPSGPVTVVFAATNFTIGGVGQPRLQFDLDNDPNFYTLVNGTDNKIFQNGVEVAEPEWLTPTSFRFNSLSDGQHQLRLYLVGANGVELTNPEASTAVMFSGGVPASSAPTIIPVSPAPGSQVTSPVAVTFLTVNHQIGLAGQPHLHFYVDGDPVVHEFFNGPGINDINGVQYQNAHTHFVHWQGPTSFRLFALPAGQHEVRFVLADASHGELGNPEATQTLTFDVPQSAGTGDFLLESVIDNVDVDGIAFAPGGQVFFVGAKPGNVWVIDTAGGPWQLRSTPFYHTAVGQIGEQGLTGIAIDPNYATNKFVYIYFSTPDEQFNRLVRVTDVNGQATNETILLDHILAADQHNGGVLLFGPDGKLYVTVGEATQEFLAQDVSSPNGKILRINTDGSIPSDNPFPGFPAWAYGMRNSFGLAFHPVTNDLWNTENGPTVNDEVNLIVKAGNYGWPIVTGPAGTPPYIDPIFTLPQPVGITNIVALAATSVYSSQYHNNLFFTDFVEGKIRRLELGPGFTTLSSSSVVFDGGTGGLIAFKQGPDGYMYVSSTDRNIYRVVPNPNAPQ